MNKTAQRAPYFLTAFCGTHGGQHTSLLPSVEPTEGNIVPVSPIGMGLGVCIHAHSQQFHNLEPYGSSGQVKSVLPTRSCPVWHGEAVRNPDFRSGNSVGKHLMKLVPLIRGHANLSTTKWILFRYLKENCEEDYPLVYGKSVFSENKHDYGLELYEDSFMVWEIPGRSWLFTTVHVSVKETSHGIRLDYHIRFNLYTNFLFLLVVGATAHFFYKSILENESMDFNLSLIGIGTILISLWSFNSDARSNLEFIRSLEKKFAKPTHEK